MKITITIDWSVELESWDELKTHPELLALLKSSGDARTPPAIAGRNSEPVAPPPASAPTPKADPAPMTGNQLLGWIGEQPDPQDALKRAQTEGKKAGYGWQIKSWKPEQVARVYARIVAPQWGGPAAEKGARK